MASMISGGGDVSHSEILGTAQLACPRELQPDETLVTRIVEIARLESMFVVPDPLIHSAE